MAKNPFLMLVLLLGFVFIVGCSDDKEEPRVYEKKKIFFCTNAFDYVDDPNCIVNVYVDDVLIGTLTKGIDMFDTGFLNQYFNADTDTSSAFGILYVLDKASIKYRFETIPSPYTHHEFEIQYDLFDNPGLVSSIRYAVCFQDYTSFFK